MKPGKGPQVLVDVSICQGNPCWHVGVTRCSDSHPHDKNEEQAPEDMNFRPMS